jgi:hypothetical protein
VSFLRVTVDRVDAAVIDTSGREVISIRVGGTKIDDDYADLGVTGGTYGQEGPTDHRIWIDQMALKVGQVVGVEFVEHGIQTGTGKTMIELYPAHSEAGTPRPLDRAGLAAELREMAPVRPGYEIRFVRSDGSAATLFTTPDEHGFGFSVLWNSLSPDRVSVSLHSYTLDSIVSEAPGRSTVREKMALGEAVRLELIA